MKKIISILTALFIMISLVACELPNRIFNSETVNIQESQTSDTPSDDISSDISSAIESPSISIPATSLPSDTAFMNSSPEKWEYHVQNISGDIHNQINTLNFLGEQGWELITVCNRGFHNFKRPLQ